MFRYFEYGALVAELRGMDPAGTVKKVYLIKKRGIHRKLLNSTTK